MDDNLRPYRSVILEDCLEIKEIARMEWLVYSLNRNPIENFWDAFGRAVCACFPHPATLKQLQTDSLE